MKISIKSFKLFFILFYAVIFFKTGLYAQFFFEQQTRRMESELQIKWSEMFLFGMELYKEASYDLALIEFKRFIYYMRILAVEYPVQSYVYDDKLCEARFWIGMTHYQDGNYQQAVKEFLQAVTDLPYAETAPNCLFEAGRLMFIKYTKNHLKAKIIADRSDFTVERAGLNEILQRVESEYPRSSFAADAVFLNGCLYDFEKNYSEAAKTFRYLVKTFSENNKTAAAMEFLQKYQGK